MIVTGAAIDENRLSDGSKWPQYELDIVYNDSR